MLNDLDNANVGGVKTHGEIMSITKKESHVSIAKINHLDGKTCLY
jgi:hypothetical protein